MVALVEGLPLKVDMIYSEEMPNSPHLGLNLGPLDNGIDWRVECPKLQTLLLEEAERTSRTCYQNNAFRLSVAADWLEEFGAEVPIESVSNTDAPTVAEVIAALRQRYAELSGLAKQAHPTPN